MDEDDAQQATRAQEEEGGVAAEQRGVGELQQRSQHGVHDGRARVRDAELVEVVRVRQPEDDGR